MAELRKGKARSARSGRKTLQADVAIVGAGIVGLAHAFAAVRRGLSVVVFERSHPAIGASVRNFGLIWPVGQPFGTLHSRAMRAREVWLELARQVPIECEANGSLHLAHHPDELGVMEEFVARDNGGTDRRMLTPAEVMRRSPAVVRQGLLGGLWSGTELTVNPRQAIRDLPGWLAKRHRVHFRFGTPVNAIAHPCIETAREKWKAGQILVCSGADFETLYPDIFTRSGMTKCKLQMMRTVAQPRGWRLGPSLCGGLTLIHYASFRCCPGLGRVRKRFERTLPFFLENGIHVLVSQTGAGELTLGDSHHYGLTLSPFDREEIDRAVLEYFSRFARVPTLEIAERWHGIYPKLEGKTEFIKQVEPGVTIVNGLGGAGMTLSFGLAEEVLEERFNA